MLLLALGKRIQVRLFFKYRQEKKLWDYANGFSINTKCSVSERSHLVGGE